MPADARARCELVAADADAGEQSLAENVVRVAKHPADQFEARRDLVERGVNLAAVARRLRRDASIARRGCKQSTASSRSAKGWRFRTS